MSFGSSFGRLSGKGGKKIRKNPLGETVTPAVTGPLEERVIGGALGIAATPVQENIARPAVVGSFQENFVIPEVEKIKEVPRLTPSVHPEPFPRPRPPSTTPPAPPTSNPRHGIAIIGRFAPWPWKQRPAEAYLADALESLGLRVVRVHQDLYTAPVKSVECVLFTGHPASFSRIDRWRGTHPTVIWAPALVPGFPEYDPVLEAARNATLFVSGDQFDWEGSMGFSHHAYLPAACDPKSQVFQPRPTIPCAFIGSIYSERRRRIAGLVKKFDGVVLDRMGLYRYGPELAAFVQTVKVVIGDNARNEVQGFWSARNYIVPGAGGFLLTPKVPGLEADLVDGQEASFYDSEDQLEEKLIHWMLDNDARELVRRAGYERTRRSHTWEERAKGLLKLLAERVYAR